MTLPRFVGRYEVREEIARGGFAVVVKAWDEELECLVALKILHESLADDAGIEQRFLQEARLLRRVNSPHVITVHDVGRLNDGRPYFVLDFADRGTLKTRLDALDLQRPPGGRCLMPLVEALAEGLTAIHQAGLVHRDIKPANILLLRTRNLAAPRSDAPAPGAADPAACTLIAPDERLLVGDLGIAKDVIRDGNFPTVIGGSPLYLAPEQNDATAEITPAADVYSATAVLWRAVAGRPPPTPDRLEDQLTGLDPAWQDLMRQGLAIDPKVRHLDMEAWRNAVHGALEHAASDIGVLDGAGVGICPYKGLAAYQVDDARFFRGREVLVDELVRRIQLHQVLVVGGPSGSGKSSLVRAGLLPALRDGVLPGSEHWQIIVMTPGRDPLHELCAALDVSLDRDTAPATGADGDADSARLRQMIATCGLNEHDTLIFVDQFEELFTLAPPDQRTVFFSILSAVTDLARSRVKLVVAIRADFYSACAQIPWLAGKITNNQVLVGPMTRAELRRAVAEPARLAGLYLEQGLIEAVLDETGSEAGSLPLMSHALVETWVRRRGNTLTLEGFRAAGGVAGAISQTADATYQHQLDDEGREATKRLFLRLVTPSEGVPETRRALPRVEIELDDDAEIKSRVVEQLTRARLLSVDDDRIQIAHEALLRTWPRLRGWIEESRDDLRMRQKILHAAAEWEGGQRDDDLLYRGTPLLSALEWHARNPGQLGPLGREFLDASETHRARLDAIAEDRLRRTRRWRRAAVVTLAILAAGTSLSSLIAYRSANEARANAERAAVASREAKERFVTALGSAAFGHVREDPRLALALAAEAIARAGDKAPSYDTRAAIITARQTLAHGEVFVLGSPIPAGDSLTIALRPDGGLLAIGQTDGTIDLFDVASQRRRDVSLVGHEGAVRSMEFDGTGRSLVSAGVDGTVRLWSPLDVGTVKSRLLGQAGDIVEDVCLHPYDPIAASASFDGTVRLWDTAGIGEARAPLAQMAIEFKTVEFSPDGRAVLAGSNDAMIRAWSLPSGEPIFPEGRRADGNHLIRLVFNPQGHRVVTIDTDGHAALLSYPHGKQLGPVFAPGAKIAAAVFSADGRLLVGGDDQGMLRLWDMQDGREIGTTFSGHSQPILDASISADHRLLATLGGDQTIRFWTLGADFPLAARYAGGGSAMRSVTFSPDGRYLAAGGEDGTVRLWGLAEQVAVRELTRHTAGVWALAFSGDGQWLASADRSGAIRLLDPESGAERHALKASGPVWSLAFTQGDRFLLAATSDGVEFWSPASGTRQRVLSHPVGQITRMALSPSGDRIATASTDGRVRIVDADQGTERLELIADEDLIWSVAFSPDGTRLATGSGNEVAAVWDLASGDRLAHFSGHTGGATDVRILGDGVTLVVNDREGRLHWWDLTTRRKLTPPMEGHRGTSWRMTLHPDGTTLATAGDDGLAKVWDLLDIDRACTYGQPSLDAGRRQQYLGRATEVAACDRVAGSAQPHR